MRSEAKVVKELGPWAPPDSLVSFELGAYRDLVQAKLAAAERQNIVARIWSRDGTVWHPTPQRVKELTDRLGWLELPMTMQAKVPELRSLAAQVQDDGIDQMVLLGMGGSSLAPEVMRQVLGVAQGYADLIVLDSTIPSQICHVTEKLCFDRTLFIVASKSGNTIEMDTLYAHYKIRSRASLGAEKWHEHFIAITDPGTELVARAERRKFRGLYLNPADVGGRYSALSLFGLVPAALLGVDIGKLLERAQDMAVHCRIKSPAGNNPGLALGTIMGVLSHHNGVRRDKLTLISSPGLEAFGVWVEQLVAESTGKTQTTGTGKTGILPVAGEPLRSIAEYGPDRLFVYLRLDGADNAATDAHAATLVKTGHPLVTLRLKDVYDLGAQFFVWEFATAVAGHFLEVNPFDQPDVQSAKKQTEEILKVYLRDGKLPEEPPTLKEGALTVYSPSCQGRTLRDCVEGFIKQARPGDYVAILAFIERCASHEALLGKLQSLLGAKLHLAVTTGFGPRFLHSTGQLHKGGLNNGLFVQLTQDDPKTLEIPYRHYSFNVLSHAQALGDLAALRELERRVVSINLGSDVEFGLQQLIRTLEEARLPPVQ